MGGRGGKSSLSGGMNSFSEVEKKVLSLALQKEKDFNPVMNDYYYYEKIKTKYPDLAKKGSILSIMDELKTISISSKDFDEIKSYLLKQKRI